MSCDVVAPGQYEAERHADTRGDAFGMPWQRFHCTEDYMAGARATQQGVAALVRKLEKAQEDIIGNDEASRARIEALEERVQALTEVLEWICTVADQPSGVRLSPTSLGIVDKASAALAPPTGAGTETGSDNRLRGPR